MYIKNRCLTQTIVDENENNNDIDNNNNNNNDNVNDNDNNNENDNDDNVQVNNNNNNQNEPILNNQQLQQIVLELQNKIQNLQNDKDVLNVIRDNAEIQTDLARQKPFVRRFTGDGRDTLQYIFDMKLHFESCLIKRVETKFNVIFNSFPRHVKSRYMEDKQGDEEDSIELLETWLLKTFPPPHTKEGFIKALENTKLRYKEDPLNTYNNFNYKIKTLKMQ